MTNTIAEATQPAAAQEAVAYWLAVDDSGFVAFGMSADDGNQGGASRQEVNDDINRRLNRGEPLLHLIGTYAAAPVASAPVEGGQITGWRNIDGMVVFSMKPHASILPDQDMVRYDDHLAALEAASTPAAPGIDPAALRQMLDGWKNSDYPFSYEGQCAQKALNACIADLQGLLIDASPKGGSEAAWDDCKVAFGFNGDEGAIFEAWERGNLSLPCGWSLNETDAAGARLVVVFRVEGVLPGPADSAIVRALLDRLQATSAEVGS